MGKMKELVGLTSEQKSVALKLGDDFNWNTYTSNNKKRLYLRLDQNDFGNHQNRSYLIIYSNGMIAHQIGFEEEKIGSFKSLQTIDVNEAKKLLPIH